MRVITLIFMVLLGSSACAQAQDKLAVVSKATAFQQRLLAVVQATEKAHRQSMSVDYGALTRQIRSLLKAERDEAVIQRIAMDCFVASFPGRAGEEGVDAPYQACWDVALAKLGRMNTQAALNSLVEIRAFLRLDGGESLTVNELIAAKEAQRRP